MKVFFLVNNISEFNFKTYIDKYLKNVDVIIDDKLPEDTESFRLIVLWNYKKIIKNLSDKNNIIVFHGSNLPKEKGWAPIYYSFTEPHEYYTITGIVASDKVDAGNIFVQAQFRIKDNYTATTLRKFDDEISIILVKKTLEKFENKLIVGVKQKGEETFHSRRRPEENEIDFESKISDVFNHLRACEKQHPAFFYFNSIKYLISVEPEIKTEFPQDLKITFYD